MKSVSYTVSYKREPGYLFGGFVIGLRTVKGTYAQLVDELWESEERQGKTVEGVEIRRDGKTVHERWTPEYRKRKREMREHRLAEAWKLVEQHGCTCQAREMNDG